MMNGNELESHCGYGWVRWAGPEWNPNPELEVGKVVLVGTT